MHARTHPPTNHHSLTHTLMKKDTEKELSWFETKVEDTVYFLRVDWSVSKNWLFLKLPYLHGYYPPAGNGGWWIDTQGS